MKIGLPMTVRVLFTVIERATTYPIFAIRVMLSPKYVKKNELSKLSIQFFSSVWILSTNVLDLYFNLHLYIHVLVLALDQRVDPALIPSPSAKSVPRGGNTVVCNHRIIAEQQGDCKEGTLKNMSHSVVLDLWRISAARNLRPLRLWSPGTDFSVGGLSSQFFHP